MAVSTVSTVNMYLQSNAQEAVPTVDNNVKHQNIIFPTFYTGLASQIAAFPQYEDCIKRFTYTGSSGLSAYANGDYTITSGSYGRFQTGLFNMGTSCFDNNYSTYFGFNSGNITNNVDGIANTPAPTGSCYSSTGTYVGGGSNYFFTTIYDGGFVNGDYIQVQLPFKYCLMSLSVARRLGTTNRTPKTVAVVGSDDGSSWTLIQSSLTYPQTMNDNTWYTSNITSPTMRFTTIRFIVIDGWSANLNFSLQFTGDAYDLTADRQ